MLYLALAILLPLCYVGLVALRVRYGIRQTGYLAVGIATAFLLLISNILFVWLAYPGYTPVFDLDYGTNNFWFGLCGAGVSGGVGYIITVTVLRRFHTEL